MNPTDRLTRVVQALASGPRSLVLAVAAALLAAGLASVAVTSGGDSLSRGEARLIPDGDVEVSLSGAEFTGVTEDVVLVESDRVRVLAGHAVLELPEGSVAELRSRSQVGVGGDDGAVLTLERGDLLMQVSDGTAAVDGEIAEVTVGAGAARLERSASLVAGVYEGSAIVAGQGRSLSIPPLRQAAVVGAGRLPDEGGVRPLQLDEGDEWDRRFLGTVLELDRRLVAFGRGFEAILPPDEAITPSLYRTLLPPLTGAPLTSDLLAERSAGENLIGLSLVALDDAPFDDSYEHVFELRDSGARWGLIAADLGYDPPEVVDAVELAIDRAPLEVAAPEVLPENGDAGGPPPGGSPSEPQGPSTTTPPGDDDDDGGGSSTTTTTALLPLPPSSSSTTTTLRDCVLPGLNLLC